MLGYSKKGPLIENASFSLRENGFYFLTGASGSGKTSFFKALLMSLEPFQGRITLLGKKTRGLPLSERTKLRRRIGMVFQDLRLLGNLTVLENIALPLHIRGFDITEALEQAKDLLAWMGVHVAMTQSIETLSGGERQRVAIARAVMTRPALLLADEPTGQIDDEAAVQVTTLIERLNKIGTTIIMATHNQELITQFGHPILRLDSKKLTLEEPIDTSSNRRQA
jgi:cell division transport system ATP-binding protein